MKLIDTEEFSLKLRGKAIDIEKKQILITNYSGSDQEKDLTEPANCNGFGRIRHFKLGDGKGWPINPLPIFPASKALGVSPESEIKAQVFQNAICNWRCWYCFVDFKLLSGNKKYSSFLTCDELLDLYLSQTNPPTMIDLTGGQPDLTPEWVPWMIEALKDRGLNDKVFLWSDDNLSNDYFWRYLKTSQIDEIIAYKKYSRVCCFKGIDEDSFSANTLAHPSLFLKQFELFQRIYDLKLDLYGYITLTASTKTNFQVTIPKVIDRLQSINELLPLRITPLKVSKFTPVESRMTDKEEDLLNGQFLAMEVWSNELARRFSKEQLSLPITEIKIY